MNKNYVITLAYNLVSETTKATERLYAQNNKEEFIHYIIDLGFPLEHDDVIPAMLSIGRMNNSVKLKELASRFGSTYIMLPNVGVQQNWTAVIQLLKMHDSDVIIGADPDEVVLNDGWVRAMAQVLRSGKIALASLMQIDVEPQIKPSYYIATHSDNTRIWLMQGLLNWALIGFSGEFLNKIGGVIPHPEEAKIYGYIEMISKKFIELDYDWALLPDFKVEHTNNVKLYRAWKDYIILEHPDVPQISFDDFLIAKREGGIA